MPEGGDAAILDPTGSFRQRLVDDRLVIAGLVENLWSAPDRTGRIAQLEVVVHRLAGAAGTFGFAAISEAAIAMEDGLIAARGAGSGPDKGALRRLQQRLFGALETALGPLAG